MNKQEVIEKIEACKSPFISEDDTIFNYGLDKALSIIKQLDEPEKPVVPQFVADWLEVCKDNLALSLASSMNNIVMRTNNQPDKTIHWLAKNSETFAKAWLFGYEVEKEELYTVEIPNPNSPEHFVLRKNGVNKIVADCYLSDNWKLYKNTWLTEAEIKKDFDWAWQFAKEVKEND